MNRDKLCAILVAIIMLIGFSLDTIPVEAIKYDGSTLDKPDPKIIVKTKRSEPKYKIVTVTSYCSCEKCCGPNAKGITASGKKVKTGMIAASMGMKFGTRVRINGQVYTVEDRLARRFDDRIDIYMDSHEDALKFGKRNLS